MLSDLLALAPFRYQQILTGVGYGGAITSPRDNRERIYARIAQQELRLLLRTCHKVFFLRTEDAPMPASIDHSFFYFPWFF